MRPFYIVSLIMLVIGSVWGLYRYSDVLRSMRDDKTTDLRMAEMRTRFAGAFAGLGTITAGDIANGFWYTYTDADGNEHVFYFDPDTMIREDLTDDELKQLTSVLAKSRIMSRASIKPVAEADLPPELQFHNALYSFGTRGATTIDIERALEEKVRTQKTTSDDLFRLSYVYELEGKYAERDRLNSENCTRFGERCESSALLTISGRVTDDAGAPVASARVEIVSRISVLPVTTNAEGVYSVQTPIQSMEKLRIRASKRNFSDGYADAILLSEGTEKLTVEDITLESPINIVTVDFAERTVTGSNNTFKADGTAVIITPRSFYEIPQNTIVGADGKPYKGPIDVYLYEFTKGNPPESLMQLDTFDAVRGYAGDLMKTFGMPYIQFFTQDGEELHVLKSRPMRLTYRIADMAALRENSDQIYEPLTSADMQFLVSASIGRSYRIDREFLINNQLLRFPAFWVFDRKRGVWDNVGITVLDIQGTIQTIFYTIRDD